MACKNDLISFKHLFTQSVKKKFTDSHLWFSVISRPTKSNFTRLQRISCCISLLFCTMIANAMFYKAEGSSKSGVIKLGPIEFTMGQVSFEVFFAANLLFYGTIGLYRNLFLIFYFFDFFDKKSKKKSKLEKIKSKITSPKLIKKLIF